MEQEIIRLIASHLKLNVKDVKTESDLIEELGADSLDAIELTLQLEKIFDIEITDEQLDNFKTVQDIIDLVQDLK